MPRDENRTRVNYYLAWARTYLKRGDALNNSKRGVWALTETGSAISELSATQAIYDQVTQEERERARLKRLAAKKADADRGEEIEVMADDGPIDEEDWKSALLAVLGRSWRVIGGHLGPAGLALGRSWPLSAALGRSWPLWVVFGPSLG